jgi:hypothetical protein
MAVTASTLYSLVVGEHQDRRDGAVGRRRHARVLERAPPQQRLGAGVAREQPTALRNTLPGPLPGNTLPSTLPNTLPNTLPGALPGARGAL